MVIFSKIIIFLDFLLLFFCIYFYILIIKSTHFFLYPYPYKGGGRDK